MFKVNHSLCGYKKYSKLEFFSKRKTIVFYIDQHPQEIEALNSSIGYLLIYKFDRIPKLNEIDGWTVFCPSNFHSFYIDNEQTRNHQSSLFIWLLFSGRKQSME